MKTIRLYGDLGKKFGKVFQLDVKSPAEAVRALCVMLPGFRQHFEKYSEPGYIVRVGGADRGAEELSHPCSAKETIKIIPAVAGGSNVVRIIVGIILIVASFWIDPTGTTGGMIASAMFGVGVSLVVGGVAGLLAPSPPKVKTATAPEATPSYMFDGPVNTIGSGYSVSVGYGTLLIGSHVVSAELYSSEEPI